MKLRAALLVDSLRLCKWQKDALSEVTDLLDVALILNCTNTVTKKKPFRHAGYYALNLVSIRSRLTEKEEVEFGDVEVIDFASRYSGAWQHIPDHVIDALRANGIGLVVKFGMSLLRIDNLDGLDVLSFHHGDPRYYRGRPAGFYEMCDGARSMGMIVQKLSNVLDAGEVLALGHSRIVMHSYKQTVQGLYRGSSQLFRRALINYRGGRTVRIRPKGKNYRLPGNMLVARFCMHLLMRKGTRLLYGAFFEKKWNIGLREAVDPLAGDIGSVASARLPEIQGGYVFYADPFFSSDGARVRVEALDAATGKGTIIELDALGLTPLRTLLAGPHYSYPYSVSCRGKEFVVPEVASHGAPYLFDPSGERGRVPLLGLENSRIVDPSIVEHEGHYYLFGGTPESASTMLHLFVADALEGPYRPHPLNPVVIDPSRARMGGRVGMKGDRMIRYGQDNSGDYGNGIAVMEIRKLTPDDYEEREIARLSFPDAKGPHTIDVSADGMLVFDYYVEGFSLLAGYRRMAAKLFPRFHGNGSGGSHR